MLEKEKIDEILKYLASASVTDRLKGVEKAQAISKKLFKPHFTVEQWSRAAITVETLYNLLRNELRQKQVRLTDRVTGKSSDEGEAIVKKPTGSKTKITKVKAKATSDFSDDVMDKMLQEFMKKKGLTNEGT